MITKMKKLTFLVYHKEYEEFLNSLRELGVVHIVEKQQGAADNTELQENIRLSNRLTATLKLLQNQKHEKDAVVATEGGTAARGLQVLDEVDTLQTEHGKLSQQLQGYAKEREALQAWGNFDPASVRKLKDAGYVIGFYSCSEGNYQQEWETEYNAMIINRISSKVFFVTVTKAGQEVDLDVEQAKLPAYSLAHLETLYNTTEQAIEENEKKLVALSETDVPSLKVALKELQGQIEFSKVVLSSEQAAGDKLMLTEVLNYLGYGIDKETLARNYLDMRDTVTQGCFVEYFWGSPWKTTGSGCFAPAIANAANSFLKSQNSSYSAYIMSYSPVEDLFTELSLGHPVIVWTSYNYNDPEVKYNDVTLDDGTVFTWPRNEHCASLAGYDIDRGVVTLADPTYGIVERSMEEFVTYYQKYYYQAVVVR